MATREDRPNSTGIRFRSIRMGRGAQLEFQTPVTLTAVFPSFGDGAGSAIGDSVASAEGAGGVPLSIYRSIERGGKQALGRGPQIEFQSAITLGSVPATFGDGDGSAIGDAVASGEIDALGDFAGSASGDSIASGDFDALGDFAGAASGDAIASGDFAALADFAGSAIGDAIVSGALDALGDFAGSVIGDAAAGAEGGGGIPLPFSRSIERGAKQTLGRGPQVAFEVPLPLRAPTGATTVDADGSAIGDAIASGTLDALADFAGSAIGDSVASGALDALADFAGSAIGDAIASGDGSLEGNGAGSAIGDSAADGTLDALADFVGAASGDSVASGAADGLADMAGSAIGDSVCEGFIEDATPAAAEETPIAQQSFPGAWGKPVRKPKRKKRLDDLDEMIAELRSRIEEVPIESTADDIYQRALRVSQSLARQSHPSLREIDNQIALLRAALQEIDDEEAILLLAA